MTPSSSGLIMGLKSAVAMNCQDSKFEWFEIWSSVKNMSSLSLVTSILVMFHRRIHLVHPQIALNVVEHHINID
jgi:hypothetical protein